MSEPRALPPLTLDLARHGVPGLSPREASAPGRPRQLAPSEVALARLLFTRRARVVLRQQDMQLRAVLLPAGAAEARDGPWLGLSVGNHPAALQLGWGMARRVTGTGLEAALGEDGALLLEDALTGWLDAAEDLLGLDISFGRLERPAPATAGFRLGLGIEAIGPRGAGFRHILPLILSAGAGQSVASALGRWLRPRERLDGLWLRVGLEVEALRLPLAALASLRVGDALLLAEGGEAPPARVIVENQWVASVAAAGPDAWRLLGPLSPRAAAGSPPPRVEMEDIMAQTEDAGPQPAATGPKTGAAPLPAFDTPAPPADGAETAGARPEPAEPRAEAAPAPAPAPRPAAEAAPASLERLEVRISVRLGETLVTLADLRQAGPGTVLTLDRPDGAAVEILANGQIIGTGDIVSVAGQRAVEIRTLFGDG